MARAAATHVLGLFSLILNGICRPDPVVHWLSRRFPDVLFHQPHARSLIALSFDDSPHQTLTPRILDLLAAHDARATFFMIGDHIPGNEQVIRRLIAEGHELGNHMLSDSSSAELSPAEFERQLRQTHDLLSPFGPVLWFRPGHGWFNQRMLDQVHRHGYRCGMASAYALEFLPIPASYAARHILRNIRSGGVIVLHDGGADRVRTVNVLRRILPELRRRGYRIVAMSALAAAVTDEQAEPVGRMMVKRSLNSS